MPHKRPPDVGPVSRIPEHNHLEAYCLMKYQSKDAKVVEYLWNSRDGVTPFSIGPKDEDTGLGDDDQDLLHSDWREDTYNPLYIPAVGSRIFVNATPKLVRPRAVAYVDRLWDAPGDFPLREINLFDDRAATKDEVVEFFIKRWTYHEERHPETNELMRLHPQPWVLRVDANTRSILEQRASWELDLR
jgi:hypothetical protein